MKVLEEMLKREEQQLKSQKGAGRCTIYGLYFVMLAILIVTGYCAKLITGRHGAYLDRDKLICIS